MIDPTDGLDPMTVEAKTLQSAITAMENAIKRLQAELDRRTGDGAFKYGIPIAGDYLVFDTFPLAVEEAVKLTGDPDAGYRVAKVYV